MRGTRQKSPSPPTTSFDLYGKDFLLEAAAYIARWLHLRIDVNEDTMLYISYMYSEARKVEAEMIEREQVRNNR